MNAANNQPPPPGDIPEQPGGYAGPTPPAPASHSSTGASWLRIAVVGRNPKITFIRAAALAVICIVVFKWVLLPVRVEGLSMDPTYRDHSVNFINRLAFLAREPKRGDVVGVRLTPPDGLATPHIMYLKRIIGLPGESVAFAGGRVMINGQPLDEPYEKGPCDWNAPAVTLGPDEYFVVGDNRSMPREDHVFGRALRSRIVGKALL